MPQVLALNLAHCDSIGEFRVLTSYVLRLSQKKKTKGGGEKILVGVVSRIQFCVRGVVQLVN